MSEHVLHYNFFEVAFFESIYPIRIESSMPGVVPEKVETLILDREVDFVCGGVGG
jgi:hypothetical protein